MITQRDSCRLCGAGLLHLLALGEQYIATYYEKPGEEIPYPHRIPLTLTRCWGCGAVQLAETVNPELLFRRYWYRSGVNPAMERALGDIVKAITDQVKLTPEDRVLDIGSNDWTLLSFYPPSLPKIGCDPSQIAKDTEPPPNAELISDFFSGQSGPVKVITAIAMLYDLDDPKTFLQQVAQCLEPGGVFVAQMSYLPLMIRQVAFDNICHEHLFYYDLGTLKQLFEEVGLPIFRAELNAVNGGSVRIYAGVGREDDGSVSQLRTEYELDLGFKLKRFAYEVEERARGAREYIEGLKASDKVVHVLGASTKGNVFLQYAGITGDLVEYAEERNPDKHGARTLGTEIPIRSEDLTHDADVKLVLPWHFLPGLVSREANYLCSGGELLLALPQLLSVTQRNYGGALRCFNQSLGLPQ